ncbi:MAG: hypothetical protein PHT33_07125 [bacterium]|nr:hypothetical protein [bacterium]
MHTVTIYPLGNAETMLIHLENNRKILIDYANMRDPDDKYDLRCDLPKLLTDDLNAANSDYYDAVAFTHLDDDHIHGMSGFFWLEHAQCYQDENRIKISELWVPAAVIVETNLDGDARILRAEARHRLRSGTGIRVFSAPDTLKGWFEDEGLDIDDYRSRGLILDAGKIVPTFNMTDDEIEFFIHSPFASRTDDGTLIERNKDAIVMQATFKSSSQLTQFLITADITHEEIDEIVKVTKYHGREPRLAWDILDIPHHCSYHAI